MNSGIICRLAKSDYIKLVPILVLAFYMALIPNLNYPYPVHIDEWVHIAHNNALMQAADTHYLDPFSGKESAGAVAVLEVGFHILFGVFHRISGISWVDIVRYLPSLVFMITVLSVYILARREGFGWEAALFTCLIPTTVGVMGPAFFIPAALCLMFIPLSLFLVFNFRTPWSYFLLFVFTCFMIITHATSAIILIIIIVPSILLYLKSEPKHGLMLVLVWAIPFLVTLPWTYDLIMSTARSLFVQQPLPVAHDLPRLIQTYGYIPCGVGLLGVFYLTMKGGVKNYSLVFGLLIVLLMLATFFSLHYGVGLIYLRGILFALLMLSIVAGAGLMMIKNLELPSKLDIPRFTKKMGYILCLALIVAILVMSIPARQRIPYYHMIDRQDYNAFIWIRDNVDEDYQTAILDPWKATAFVAVTEKYVYTRIHMAPQAKDNEAQAFLRDGCLDTTFLRENGISIVYTQSPCNNPDLTEVRKNVYLVKEKNG